MSRKPWDRDPPGQLIKILTWMPEWSKGTDLRSVMQLHAWVQTPLQVFIYFKLISHSNYCLPYKPEVAGSKPAFMKMK